MSEAVSGRYPARAYYHNGQGGGVIDVTKPPFNAKGDGVTDDTEALSRAMRFVRDRQQVACSPSGQVVCNRAKTSNWTIWLPNGTYLVSDTVSQMWPAQAINIERGWSHVRLIDVCSPLQEEDLGTLPGFKPLLHDNPAVAVIKTPDDTYLRGQYANASLYSEANENIRLEGESRDGVVIRLADRSRGFGTGACKPVLSFALLRRGSNINQGNFLRNLTIDTGRGNPGAAALLWSSSNFGGLRSVSLRSSDGKGAVGIDLSVNNVCGYVRDLSVSGFDVGFSMTAGRESVLTVEDSQVRDCALGFRLGDNRAGAGGDMLTLLNVRFENVACKCEQGRASSLDERLPVAAHPRLPTDLSSVAVVDDYGAAGDGVTDDTEAVRRACASGKKTVLFVRSNYRLDGVVPVPSSVETIDGLHANLVRTKACDAAVFRCAEDASAPLVMRRLYFAGGVLFDHVSRRVSVFEDIYTEFHHVREQCFVDGFYLPQGCDAKSGLWYAYRNATPSVRKRVFAADCIQFSAGGDPQGVEALVNVELDARLLNSEHFPGAAFVFRKSCARIYGIKSEGDPQMFALRDAEVTAVNGSLLLFGKDTGPVVDARDSFFDIGTYLWHWQFVPDVLVCERRGSAEQAVTAAAFASNDARQGEIARENACFARLRAALTEVAVFGDPPCRDGNVQSRNRGAK